MIVYGNVYDNSMLFDDQYLIVKNEYLRHWSSLGAIFTNYVSSGASHFSQFYRPLQNLLYLVIYQSTGGLSLFGFHIENLVLHAANACLVFRLGTKLGYSIAAVFFAALFWAVHPLHTEVVTYMSGSCDLLFTFFCLFGIVVLLPDFAPRKFLYASALFVFALLSKEASVVFPLLVICTMFAIQPKQFGVRTIVRSTQLWFVMIVYFVFRYFYVPLRGRDFWSSSPTAQFYGTHITARIYTYLATLPTYVELLVKPTGLHMDREFPVYVNPFFLEVGLGAVIVIAALLFIFLMSNNSGQALRWGLLWFGCAQIPQSGILTPANGLIYEHWMYLPSVGLFLGLSETLHQWLRSALAKKVAAVLALCATVVLAVMTYEQNSIWHDEETFYKNIVENEPRAYRSHTNLGILYLSEGLYEAAREQFDLAMKNPTPLPENYQNVASLLGRLPGDHVEEEIRNMQQALDLNPDFLPACDGLAVLYASLGKSELADLYRDKATSIRMKLKR